MPVSGAEGIAGAQRTDLPKPSNVDNEISSLTASVEDGFDKSILVHEVEHRLKKNELPKMISKEEAEAGVGLQCE